jgi:hypothetical protein
MKKTILLIATSFLIGSPLHAIPLTWHFTGTTSSSSKLNGMPIAAGLNYELRIFLDTKLVGVPDNTGNPEVTFLGPHQGEVEIGMLGVLPVDPISFVQYFAVGGLVTEVIFYNPEFNFIHFDSSISSDSLHLTRSRRQRQRQTQHLIL